MSGFIAVATAMTVIAVLWIVVPLVRARAEDKFAGRSANFDESGPERLVTRNDGVNRALKRRKV